MESKKTIRQERDLLKEVVSKLENEKALLQRQIDTLTVQTKTQRLNEKLQAMNQAWDTRVSTDFETR